MKLTERQLRSIVRKTISESKKRTLKEDIEQATQKFSDEMDLFLAAMETDPSRAKELLGNVQDLLDQWAQEVETASQK